MNVIMKTVFLFLVALCLSGTTLNAQEKSFNDIMSINLRNMGPIVKDNAVTGYYMFYKVDKVDRKTNTYKLKILDQDLNEVNSKKITDTKYLYLLEGAYNGNAIMLKFYDYKKRIVRHQIYDGEGNLITKKEEEISKNEAVTLLGPDYNEATSISKDVYAVPGVGFLDFKKTRGKGMISGFGYDIKFIPDTKGAKGWSKKSEDTKGNKMASFLAANENMVITTIVKTGSKLAQKMDQYVMGIDTKTGKKLFESSLAKGKYQLQLVNGYTEDDGSITLVGLYYDQGQNKYKGAGKGVASLSVSKDGKISEANFVSWTDIGKVLPVDKRGRIKDVGFIFFHQFVKTADGKIFGVGESYRKSVSGTGVALNLLGGGGISMMKMVIEDIFVFEFTSDFKIKNVDVYEKGKSNIQLPEGYGLSNQGALARMIHAWGSFDYEFIQQAKDKSYFIVGYRDSIKKKGEKRKNYFGALSYSDGAFTKDEIDLKTDASSLRVYPAKNGSILITEYFRKTKKLDMRVEQLNF